MEVNQWRCFRFSLVLRAEEFNLLGISIDMDHRII